MHTSLVVIVLIACGSNVVHAICVGDMTINVKIASYPHHNTAHDGMSHHITSHRLTSPCSSHYHIIWPYTTSHVAHTIALRIAPGYEITSFDCFPPSFTLNSRFSGNELGSAHLQWNAMWCGVILCVVMWCHVMPCDGMRCLMWYAPRCWYEKSKWHSDIASHHTPDAISVQLKRSPDIFNNLTSLQMTPWCDVMRIISDRHWCVLTTVDGVMIRGDRIKW